MAADFTATFEALKPVFGKCAARLVVKTDTPVEYSLVTKNPSPLTQHKGHSMFFGSVKRSKAYVSLHLMPIYMCDPLQKLISPALKKHMQGKSCFNFKAAPAPELLAELRRLAEAGLKGWIAKKWA